MAAGLLFNYKGFGEERRELVAALAADESARVRAVVVRGLAMWPEALDEEGQQLLEQARRSLKGGASPPE